MEYPYDYCDYGIDMERAAREYYNQMYEEYYHLRDPEPCCSNCRYYEYSSCTQLAEDFFQEELTIPDPAPEQNDNPSPGSWKLIVSSVTFHTFYG